MIAEATVSICFAQKPAKEGKEASPSRL